MPDINPAMTRVVQWHLSAQNMMRKIPDHQFGFSK
jgi:hypothetical protein